MLRQCADQVASGMLHAGSGVDNASAGGLEDLQQCLREYIDGCYNPRRPHTALGNLTPFRFEVANTQPNGAESAKKNNAALAGRRATPRPCWTVIY